MYIYEICEYLFGVQITRIFSFDLYLLNFHVVSHLAIKHGLWRGNSLNYFCCLMG